MILVFGSLNMDLLFHVERLPAPGETVLGPSYQIQPGGKGMNQAVAAARAGAAVEMVGCLGSDGFGDSLLAMLKAEGIGTDNVVRAAAPTGCASVMIDAEGRNQIVVASGANNLARADQVPDTVLGPTTTVVLQMEVPVEENWRLLARAKLRGSRTILNVAPFAPVPAASLAQCDIVLLNELEASQLAGSSAAFDALARDLALRSRGICVITLGGQGSVAARDGEIIVTPAMPIVPVDTTGAGDAFTGVLAAALDDGHDLALALRRANIAGALACTAIGAQASLPRAPEIEAGLASPS